MAKIEEMYFLPPMAVARLGGSDFPLANFTWVEDPSLHGAGLTVIEPLVSLTVLGDGKLEPYRPAVLQFRDHGLLRPVAPFFELWVRIAGKKDQALTLPLLEDLGGSLAGVQYTVTAANRKAARRTGDPACAFVASIKVAGDDHAKHALLATSSANGQGGEPLVLANAPIPLGTVQVIQPVPAKAMEIDLGVLRVRFTPARGEVYGPSKIIDTAPDSPNRGRHTVVPPANRILNDQSSWVHYSLEGRVDSPQPDDTYDGADAGHDRSFGVVDDTCDLLLRADIKIKKQTFTAIARAFSAPPDFSPDRRPFISLADELIDRDPPAPDPKKEPKKETLEESLIRLGDLFRRVYETASLANLDMMRSSTFIMPRKPAKPVNFPGMAAVTYPETMKKGDPVFRNDDVLASVSALKGKVPYATMASQIHGPKADVDDLESFLREQAGRVRKIIRPAYAHFKKLRPKVKERDQPDPTQRDPRIMRDWEQDMRMPPYMRDSDGTALSLNRRQYEFLMQTVDRLQQAEKALKPGAPDRISPTQDHVARVLQRSSKRAKAQKAAASKTNSKGPSRGWGENS